jgi:hypothetical protein
MPERGIRVLEAKKFILLDIYGMILFVFLFIGELGPRPQNFIFRRGVEH